MFTEQKSIEALARVIRTQPEVDGKVRPSMSQRWESLVATVDMLLRAGLGEEELFSALAYRCENNEAIRFVRAWAIERPHGMAVLSGLPGGGKTVASTRYALQHGAAWCHAPTLCMAKFDTSDAMLRRFQDAKRLVIDDLGAHGTTTARAIDRLVTLIMKRYSKRLQTLITTNLNEHELAAVYDESGEQNRSRLIDRLKHRGVWHELTGGSYRTTERAVELNLDRTRYHDAKVCLRAIEHVESAREGEASPRAIEYLAEVTMRWNRWDTDRLVLEVAQEVERGPKPAMTEGSRKMLDDLIKRMTQSDERGKTAMNDQARSPMPAPEDESQAPAVADEDLSQEHEGFEGEEGEDTVSGEFTTDDIGEPEGFDIGEPVEPETDPEQAQE